MQGSAADAVVLGLDGFRVLDAHRVDGELELVIETTATRGWCRRCGVRAHSKAAPWEPPRWDRPVVLVRDVDGFGQPVRLRWRKRRRRWPRAGV